VFCEVFSTYIFVKVQIGPCYENAVSDEGDYIGVVVVTCKMFLLLFFIMKL